MPRTDDPALLSADQRFREVARLLAAGIRRLLARPDRAESGRPAVAKNPEKSQGMALRSAPV
jgi:hypothetical protein